MSSILNKSGREAGFTLVEVAVVVPMIILVIVGILALLITLVGSNVQQSTRSALVNNTRVALTSIEKDVDASSTFLADTLPSATFKDFNEPGLSGSYKTNGSLASGAASANLNTLFIQGYNQIADPADTTGTKIIGAFKGTPPCSGINFAQTANIVPVAVLYFVTNSTLYRRTIIDRTNPTTCGPLLIKQSCPTGSDANTPSCLVKDTALLNNVSQFKIDYYLNAADTTPLNAYVATPTPPIDQAKAIVATITSFTNSAGNRVSHSASLRMTRIGD
jgi:type II secretory pathway pseudopilin PulG